MCAYALGRRRGEPGVHQLDRMFDREAMRQLDRLGAAVAGRGEQFESAAAIGLWAAAEGSRHLAGGLLGPGDETTRFPHWVAYS
jgi:hypothetical protein